MGTEASKHVVAVVVQGTDALTPAAQKAAASHEAMVNTIVAGSKRMQGGMATNMGVGFQVERIRESLAVSARELPKKVLSGGLKDLLYDVKNAKGIEELGKVGDRIDVLRMKAEMLGTLGSRGMKTFGAELRAATTIPQMNALAAKIAAAGDAAQGSSFKVASLHSVIKKMVEGFGALGPAMKGFVGMFAGMFAFQGVMGLIEKMKELIGGTRELAMEQRKLHVEAMEVGLPIEELEAYRVAAAETGADIGSLRMGMRMLVMNIERNPKAFEALGISVRDSKGRFKELSEVMPQVMDLFKGVTSQTEQLALASVMFGGRMGARLIPLLTQGSAAMKAYYAEGVKLGVIMDEVSDKNLTNLARNLAVADLQMEGMKKQLQLNLIPAFEALAWALMRVGDAFRFAQAHGKWVIDPVGASLGALLSLAERKTPAYFGPPGGSRGATSAASPLDEAERRIKAFMDAMNKGEREAKEDARAKRIKEIGEAMGVAVGPATELYEKMEKLKSLDLRMNLLKDIEELKARTEPLADLVARLAEEAAKVAESGLALNATGERTLNQRGPLVHNKAAIRHEMLRNIGIKPGDLETTKEGPKQGEAGRELDRMFDLRLQMEKVNEEARSMALYINDVFGAVMSGASGAISTWMDKMFSSKSGWAKFWRSLVETALQQLNRLIMSKVFLLLIDLVSGGAAKAATGAAGAGAGSGGGVGMVPPSTAMTPVGGTTNNVTIQTFSPRDVLMQYVSPSGVLRSAQGDLAMAGAY